MKQLKVFLSILSMKFLFLIVQIMTMLVLVTSVSPLKAGSAVASTRVANLRGHQTAHGPRTIWERMRNPRAWWQSRLDKTNPSAMTARTRSSISGARPFATETIADPIFLIPPTYDSGGKFARNIEIGDFNGDSKADLVISNQCVSDTDCTQGTIAVLLGNGDGTYQPARLSNTGAILSTIAVGDFNRDGNLEVAVDNSCPDSGCTTGSINILLGKGDGTFQPPVVYPSGGNAFSVEAGDINGDGKLDLVAVNGSGSAGVLRAMATERSCRSRRSLLPPRAIQPCSLATSTMTQNWISPW